MSAESTAAKKNNDASTSDVAKALSHPMRLRILHELNKRVASPKALADELGESLAVVSYHVKILAQLGCIELVETVQKRGALEHFYRPLRRAELSSAEWAQLPESARESPSGVALREIIKEASASMVAGAFDRLTDRHLGITPRARRGGLGRAQRGARCPLRPCAAAAGTSARRRFGDHALRPRARTLRAGAEFPKAAEPRGHSASATDSTRLARWRRTRTAPGDSPRRLPISSLDRSPA